MLPIATVISDIRHLAKEWRYKDQVRAAASETVRNRRRRAEEAHKECARTFCEVHWARLSTTALLDYHAAAFAVLQTASEIQERGDTNSEKELRSTLLERETIARESETRLDDVRRAAEEWAGITDESTLWQFFQWDAVDETLRVKTR